MPQPVNREITVFSSAARTASENSADLSNPYARGAVIVIDVTASDVLPRTWRVEAAHADTDSITYSVSANLIV